MASDKKETAKAQDSDAKRIQPASDAEAKAEACSCGCGVDETIDMMPDEELLYDLADLFKVFGDTTRIKILYALMGQRPMRRRHRRSRRRNAKRCVSSAAHVEAEPAW